VTSGLAGLPGLARGLAAAALVMTSAWLAGCASRSAAPSAAPPSSGPVRVSAGDPGAAALEAFEQRQRDAAAAATRQGLWFEAAWAWEVLLALNPRDAEITRRLAEARQAATTAAAERSARGKLALQRGDNETAVRLYIEALSFVPTHIEAGEALRAIERDRVRRQHLGQVSRYTLMRRPDTAPGSAGPGAAAAATAAADAAGPASAERNEVEHASMLANQGEIDGAIAVLKPIATGRQADAGARRLLADLYVKRADTLAATDRPAAIESLERALAIEPSHARAATRLKLLKDAAARKEPAPVVPAADDRKTTPKAPEAGKAR